MDNKGNSSGEGSPTMSRFGRTRKPKISSDYCDIDELFASKKDKQKSSPSPKANKIPTLQLKSMTKIDPSALSNFGIIRVSQPRQVRIARPKNVEPQPSNVDFEESIHASRLIKVFTEEDKGVEQKKEPAKTVIKNVKISKKKVHDLNMKLRESLRLEPSKRKPVLLSSPWRPVRSSELKVDQSVVRKGHFIKGLGVVSKNANLHPGNRNDDVIDLEDDDLDWLPPSIASTPVSKNKVIIQSNDLIAPARKAPPKIKILEDIVLKNPHSVISVDKSSMSEVVLTEDEEDEDQQIFSIGYPNDEGILVDESGNVIEEMIFDPAKNNILETQTHGLNLDSDSMCSTMSTDNMHFSPGNIISYPVDFIGEETVVSSGSYEGSYGGHEEMVFTTSMENEVLCSEGQDSEVLILINKEEDLDIGANEGDVVIGSSKDGVESTFEETGYDLQINQEELAETGGEMIVLDENIVNQLGDSYIILQDPEGNDDQLSQIAILNPELKGDLEEGTQYILQCTTSDDLQEIIIDNESQIVQGEVSTSKETAPTASPELPLQKMTRRSSTLKEFLKSPSDNFPINRKCYKPMYRNKTLKDNKNKGSSDPVVEEEEKDRKIGEFKVKTDQDVKEAKKKEFKAKEVNEKSDQDKFTEDKTSVRKIEESKEVDKRRTPRRRKAGIGKDEAEEFKSPERVTSMDKVGETSGTFKSPGRRGRKMEEIKLPERVTALNKDEDLSATAKSPGRRARTIEKVDDSSTTTKSLGRKVEKIEDSSRTAKSPGGRVGAIVKVEDSSKTAKSAGRRVRSIEKVEDSSSSAESPGRKGINMEDIKSPKRVGTVEKVKDLSRPAESPGRRGRKKQELPVGVGTVENVKDSGRAAESPGRRGRKMESIKSPERFGTVEKVKDSSRTAESPERKGRKMEEIKLPERVKTVEQVKESSESPGSKGRQIDEIKSPERVETLLEQDESKELRIAKTTEIRDRKPAVKTSSPKETKLPMKINEQSLMENELSIKGNAVEAYFESEDESEENLEEVQIQNVTLGIPMDEIERESKETSDDLISVKEKNPIEEFLKTLENENSDEMNSVEEEETTSSLTYKSAKEFLKEFEREINESSSAGERISSKEVDGDISESSKSSTSITGSPRKMNLKYVLKAKDKCPEESSPISDTEKRESKKPTFYLLSKTEQMEKTIEAKLKSGDDTNREKKVSSFGTGKSSSKESNFSVDARITKREVSPEKRVISEKSAKREVSPKKREKSAKREVSPNKRELGDKSKKRDITPKKGKVSKSEEKFEKRGSPEKREVSKSEETLEKRGSSEKQSSPEKREVSKSEKKFVKREGSPEKCEVWKSEKKFEQREGSPKEVLKSERKFTKRGVFPENREVSITENKFKQQEVSLKKRDATEISIKSDKHADFAEESSKYEKRETSSLEKKRFQTIAIETKIEEKEVAAVEKRKSLRISHMDEEKLKSESKSTLRKIDESRQRKSSRNSQPNEVETSMENAAEKSDTKIDNKKEYEKSSTAKAILFVENEQIEVEKSNTSPVWNETLEDESEQVSLRNYTEESSKTINEDFPSFSPERDSSEQLSFFLPNKRTYSRKSNTKKNILRETSKEEKIEGKKSSNAEISKKQKAEKETIFIAETAKKERAEENSVDKIGEESMINKQSEAQEVVNKQTKDRDTKGLLSPDRKIRKKSPKSRNRSLLLSPNAQGSDKKSEDLKVRNVDPNVEKLKADVKSEELTDVQTEISMSKNENSKNVKTERVHEKEVKTTGKEEIIAKVEIDTNKLGLIKEEEKRGKKEDHIERRSEDDKDKKLKEPSKKCKEKEVTEKRKSSRISQIVTDSETKETKEELISKTTKVLTEIAESISSTTEEIKSSREEKPKKESIPATEIPETSVPQKDADMEKPSAIKEFFSPKNNKELKLLLDRSLGEVFKEGRKTRSGRDLHLQTDSENKAKETSEIAQTKDKTTSRTSSKPDETTPKVEDKTDSKKTRASLKQINLSKEQDKDKKSRSSLATNEEMSKINIVKEDQNLATYSLTTNEEKRETNIEDKDQKKTRSSLATNEEKRKANIEHKDQKKTRSSLATNEEKRKANIEYEDQKKTGSCLVTNEENEGTDIEGKDQRKTRKSSSGQDTLTNENSSNIPGREENTKDKDTKLTIEDKHAKRARNTSEDRYKEDTRSLVKSGEESSSKKEGSKNEGEDEYMMKVRIRSEDKDVKQVTDEDKDAKQITEEEQGTVEDKHVKQVAAGEKDWKRTTRSSLSRGSSSSSSESEKEDRKAKAKADKVRTSGKSVEEIDKGENIKKQKELRVVLKKHTSLSPKQESVYSIEEIKKEDNKDGEEINNTGEEKVDSSEKSTGEISGKEGMKIEVASKEANIEDTKVVIKKKTRSSLKSVEDDNMEKRKTRSMDNEALVITKIIKSGKKHMMVTEEEELISKSAEDLEEIVAKDHEIINEESSKLIKKASSKIKDNQSTDKSTAESTRSIEDTLNEQLIAGDVTAEKMLVSKSKKTAKSDYSEKRRSTRLKQTNEEEIVETGQTTTIERQGKSEEQLKAKDIKTSEECVKELVVRQSKPKVNKVTSNKGESGDTKEEFEYYEELVARINLKARKEKLLEECGSSNHDTAQDDRQLKHVDTDTEATVTSSKDSVKEDGQLNHEKTETGSISIPVVKLAEAQGIKRKLSSDDEDCGTSSRLRSSGRVKHRLVKYNEDDGSDRSSEGAKSSCDDDYEKTKLFINDERRESLTNDERSKSLTDDEEKEAKLKLGIDKLSSPLQNQELPGSPGSMLGERKLVVRLKNIVDLMKPDLQIAMKMGSGKKNKYPQSKKRKLEHDFGEAQEKRRSQRVSELKPVCYKEGSKTPSDYPPIKSSPVIRKSSLKDIMDDVEIIKRALLDSSQDEEETEQTSSFNEETSTILTEDEVKKPFTDIIDVIMKGVEEESLAGADEESMTAGDEESMTAADEESMTGEDEEWTSVDEKAIINTNKEPVTAAEVNAETVAVKQEFDNYSESELDQSTFEILEVAAVKTEIKEERAEMMENKRFRELYDFNDGDLAYAKLGSYPYWPCMVAREPNTGNVMNFKLNKLMYHVRFFGDRGRRSWVKQENLIPLTSKNDLEIAYKLAKERGMRSSYCRQFKVTGNLGKMWNIGVDEALSLLDKTAEERYDFFFQMFASQKEKRERKKKPESSELVIKSERIDEELEEVERKSKLVRSSSSPMKSARNESEGDSSKPTRKRRREDPDYDPSIENAGGEIDALRPLRKKVKREVEDVASDLSKEEEERLKGKRIKKEVEDVSDDISKSGTSTPELKLKTRLSQLDLSSEGSISDTDSSSRWSIRTPIVCTNETQAALYKRNSLLKGVLRDKVCQKCLKPGEIYKCKGKCSGYYHKECSFLRMKVEVMEEENDSDCQIVTVTHKKYHPPKNLSLSTDKKFRELTLSEQIDFKLKELMTPIISKTVYADSTSDTSSEDSASEKGSAELTIQHVTADDVIVVNKNKKKKTRSEDDFRCTKCVSNIDPECFVCGHEENPKTGGAVRQKCSITACGKFYHLECLKVWPQTQISLHSTSRAGLDSFSCPMHMCHICVSDNPRASISRLSLMKIVRCLKCPATYHSNTCCIPAGTEILSTTQIICPRHKKAKSGKHDIINTKWCFICSEGGDLICCETCPTSVHIECSQLNLKADDTFICEECETGRLPLYDEIVWVKLGRYRWWPALILFPNEVPENVRNLQHQHGDFVVKFFGTHDHYWVNRGRAFLFQEGDEGPGGNTNKMDQVFKKAIEEAAEAHAFKSEFKKIMGDSMKGSDKPPPYIRIKVNKPVGNVKQFDGNISNTTPCNCNPNSENPCGPDSYCINRLLMTECDPEVCPAREKCQNQKFEKREYPPLIPHKTEGRGWGLKTLAPIKKGQFVIEYVGEVIDDQEYQRRIAKMHEQKDDNYYFLTIENNRMIDAGPKGNFARFMNHCCEPNCETQKWTVKGDTRVGLFATEDIAADMEVTFNYNLESAGEQKKVCMCGAQSCSGFIGVKVKNTNDEKKVKKPTSKVARKKRSPTPVAAVVNMEPCFMCGGDGETFPCHNKICTKYYHLKCVKLETKPDGKWSCPWHNCNLCSKRTIRCCVKCVNSYCPVHSEGNVRHDKLLGFICTDHDPSKEPQEILSIIKKPRNPATPTEESDVTSTTHEEIEDSSEITSSSSSRTNLDDSLNESYEQSESDSKEKKKRGRPRKQASNKQLKIEPQKVNLLPNISTPEVILTSSVPERHLRTNRKVSSEDSENERLLKRQQAYEKALPMRKRTTPRTESTENQ